MKIRIANVADASAMQTLFSQLEQETEHIGIGETDSLALGAYLLQLVSLPHQECWLAFSDDSEDVTDDNLSDEMIGFAMLTPNYLSCDDASAALILGLKQASVGRGFGWQLLQHVEQWAIDVGLNNLELTVKEANQIALRFYLQAGFKVKPPNVGVSLDHHHGNVLYMVKELE